MTQYSVLSGQVSSGRTLNSGDIMFVRSGGLAIATTVLLGAEQIVYSSGTASGTIISAGGNETVYAGGVANGTVVTYDGAEYVSGIASGTVVSGGSQQVYSGGVASGTLVMSDGIGDAYSGGTALAVTVLNGGEEYAYAGGTLSGAVISSGGIEYVYGSASGSVVGGTEYVYGTASGTTISSGGSQYVESGGLAGGSVVGSGAGLDVSSGGAAGGAVISGGGYLAVASGGVASGTIVSSGGSATLPLTSAYGAWPAGGSATVVDGVTIENGAIASLYIYSGGSISGFVAINGLSDTIYAGGTTSGTVVGAGGFEDVYGQTSGTIVGGGDQYIEAGGVADGTVVSSGGNQYVYAGSLASGGEIEGTQYLYGSAVGVTVSGPGAPRQYVEGGAVADGTIVGSGGRQFVDGLASGTIASDGGYQEVFSGGVASDTRLSNALAYIYSGGIASGMVVTNGATEYVEAGGAASGTVVETAGEVVYAGGRAVGTVVSDGGYAQVYGQTSGTIVRSGGTEYIDAGGAASGTIVSSGGTEYIYSGGVASGTIVSSGGSATLPLISAYGAWPAGGSAAVVDGVTVENGAIASLNIYSGGSVSGFIAISGASDTIYAGGTASGTIVSSGGDQYVESGGVAGGAVIRPLGFQFVLSGGIASGTIISAGGYEIVSAGGITDGALMASGGGEYINAGGIASNAQIGGGTLELNGGGTASGTISFVAGTSGGLLLIDVTAMPDATISGFVPGNTIDLAGVPYSSAGTVNLASGHVLVVSENGSGYGLNLDPGQNLAGNGFQLSADASGGTLVSETNAPPTADTVTATGQSVAYQQSVALNRLFTVSGSTPNQYQVWLDGPADGSVTDGNAAIPIDQAVNETNLSAVDYVGGAALGQDKLWLRAYDGQWSDWALAILTDPGVTPDTVTPTNQSVDYQQSVGLNSIFAVGGPAASQYQVWLDGPADGSVRDVNGAIATNTAVDETDLSTVNYIGGGAPGQDLLWLRAYDGQWSNWQLATLTDPGVTPDTVTATNQSVPYQRLVEPSSLFSVSGPAASQYQVWLDGPADGSVRDVNGAIATNTAVNETDLGNFNYIGGGAPGQDLLWLRAYDGQWSDWTLATVTDLGAVVATNQSVGYQQSVPLSSIFTVYGPTPAGYEIWLNGPSKGSITDGTSNTIVLEQNLGNADFVGGLTSGQDKLWVRADYGGGRKSGWVMATLTDLGAVTATNQSVGYQQSVRLGSIFTVSGQTASEYQVWLTGPADGSVTDGNGAIATNTAVNETSLGSVNYIGGGVPGQDALWLRAFDGQWSSWALATLTDPGVTPPTVTPIQAAHTVPTDTVIAASDLFTVSNNSAAVAQYGFWDVGTGGGHFTVGGTVQGTNQEIDEPAAQLSQVDYVAGTGAGTDTLWVRANDGQWGSWSSAFTITG